MLFYREKKNINKDLLSFHLLKKSILQYKVYHLHLKFQSPNHLQSTTIEYFRYFEST